MNWFDRLFPVFMIGHPLILVLFIKTKAVGEQAAVAKRLVRVLVVVTTGALLVHVGVQATLEHFQPGRGLLRAVWPVLFSTLGCVLIWNKFAGPTMIAKNPAFGNNPTGEEGPKVIRTASLTARHLTDPITPRAWYFGWTFFGLCALVTCWSIAEGAPLVLVIGLLWWIGMAVLGTRRNLLEPEPLDEFGSPKVAIAYSGLRAFRSWCFFWMGITGTAVFSLLALLVLIRPGIAGFTGAFLGSAMGIGGAVFGVVASFRRAKINELIMEANAGQDPGTAGDA